MKKVYLDYASLTPLNKKVSKVMHKFQSNKYMNPSSLYKSGVAAKKVLADSRTKVAQIIHAHADEIVFTAGGTESNNLILQGLFETAQQTIQNPHIIVSAIEHSSILEVCRALEKKGAVVSYIPVDSNGIINLEILRKEIRTETILVSVMMVNNEIGSMQPIHEIAKIIRLARKNANSKYPLFHTDACQAGYLPLYVEKLGVDFMTLDGQKIYGPRGIGMLYIKRQVDDTLRIAPTIYGGGQEKGYRSGTENIPGIAGFSLALELTDTMRDSEVARLSEFKKLFIDGLHTIHSGIKILSNYGLTSPHILNVSIPGIDNEFFVLQLDVRGISCSTKSACLRDEDESYVLSAIGASSKTSVRFSFGRSTKKSDINYALKKIAEILEKTLAETSAKILAK